MYFIIPTAKMKWFYFLCATFFICFFIESAESTLCRPYSSFKLDCNICTCGSNGQEYSCTEKMCPSLKNEGEQFIEEILESGHVLLKPKKRTDKFDDDSDFILTRKLKQSRVIPNNINEEIPISNEKKMDTFDDDDFILRRKVRQSRVIPYINDEIPISNEENLEKNEFNSGKLETLQEVSNEENDVEGWDDFNNYDFLKGERSVGNL